jgi:hypothetical protein
VAHGLGRDPLGRLGLDGGGRVEDKDRSPSALLPEALVGGPDADELGPVALKLGLGGRTGPIGSDIGAELHACDWMGSQVQGPRVDPFASRSDVAQDDPLAVLKVEDWSRALTDMAGRVIEVRIDDRDGRRRHRGTLLAPVGAVVEDPASLPLFVMGGCDLVRRSGPVCDLRIDGRPLATGQLPGGWLHRRRLIKYTADPMMVICNQAHDGPPATIDPRAPGDVELDPRSGGIGALRARSGGHRARLELAPALPDVARLRPRMTVEGTWRLGIDDNPAVVGGFWTVYRRQDRVEFVVDVVQGWRPAGLPLLMNAVTRVAPVFRSWPATYRWSGTITLGDPSTLTSRWERKGDQRDESYRRLFAAPGR